VSPERLRREFLAFLRELAQTRPIIWFLDDMHSADSSSSDLLVYLAPRVSGFRLLTILAYRPGVAMPDAPPFLAAKLILARADIFQEAQMHGLNADEIAQYIRLAFSPGILSGRLDRIVLQRTEGNPLFMTEMLWFLRDRGVLAETDGQWRLHSPDTILTLIPTGVRLMVNLKVNQLAEIERDVLRCAAVQGMEFDSAVLAEILAMDATVIEELLQRLDHAHDFVRALQEREFKDNRISVRYRFLHVLYQNSLYDSLVPSRRAVYALSIAKALISLRGDTSPADLAVLFEIGRDYVSAANYFLRGARNSIRVFAYAEAATLAQRGLASVGAMGESEDRLGLEVRLCLLAGMALMITHGYGSTEAERAHDRAREICVQMGDDSRLLSALWGLHTCETNRGDLGLALTRSQEMLAVAERLANSVAIVESIHAWGTTLSFMGRLEEAREVLARILSVNSNGKNAVPHRLYVMDPWVTSLCMTNRVLTYMGHLDQAKEGFAESMQIATSLAHPPSMAYATFWVGWAHHMRGEYEDCLRLLDAAMSTSREHGMSLFLEWARVVRGAALSRAGQWDKGISEIRRSIESQDTMRSALDRPYCLTLLADSLAARGETGEALQLCDRALEFGRRTEARCHEPEVRRVRGEVLLQADEALYGREGLAEFELALDLSRKMKARLLELKAATSYCHWLRRFGNERDGQATLSEVLTHFTSSAPVVIRARKMLAGDEA
jgi:tetratricopeptide (TPR) repeat protein